MRYKYEWANPGFEKGGSGGGGVCPKIFFCIFRPI